MADKFNDVINVFPEHIRSKLEQIPENIKNDTYEIRVRKNKTLVLCGRYGTAFVGQNSIVSHMDIRNSLIVSENDLSNIISAICGYSVYSHQTDIANGFVTYGNGNRVGFCGTAVMCENKVASVSNITSLNIRISREFENAADKLLSKLFSDKTPKGLMIAGPPCSGKTTLLKSLAVKLSSEYRYGFKKCVIVDERFEMCGVNGINCDVLSGYDKETGIIHAIRTLSPQIIICDEIASDSEAEKILKGFDSGVSFIVSVHAETREDIMHRCVSSKLIRSECFDYIVILNASDKPGQISEIIKTEDILHETACDNISSCKFINDSICDYTKRKNAL